MARGAPDLREALVLFLIEQLQTRRSPSRPTRRGGLSNRWRSILITYRLCDAQNAGTVSTGISERRLRGACLAHVWTPALEPASDRCQHYLWWQHCLGFQHRLGGANTTSVILVPPRRRWRGIAVIQQRLHTRMSAHVPTRVSIHMSPYMSPHTSTNMPISPYSCLHACLRTCLHACLYTRVSRLLVPIIL